MFLDIKSQYKLKLFTLGLSLLLGSIGHMVCSQPVYTDTLKIRNALKAVLERDQKTRARGDSTEFIRYIDSCNLVYVKDLIETHGWPGVDFVGKKGNQTVFLVIQHADLKTQVKYLPMLEHSVEIGQSSPGDLALLKDRILMRQGKKQIYGTQVIFNKSGDKEFYPIEEVETVNERRAKVGLGSLEEYARQMGIILK